MFNLAGTPYGVKPDFAVVALHGTQAPQRIIQAVVIDDLHNAHWLIVSLSFIQGAQQLLPAFLTWAMFADLIQGSFHFFSLCWTVV
jgi:hypothetical protein